MRIMLVYSIQGARSSSRPLASPAGIQLGLSYISAVLKRNGHRTTVAVLTSSRGTSSTKTIRRLIEESKPEVIGFSAVFSQYDFIESIAEYVKSSWPDIFLLVGGTHVSLAPEVLGDSPFDAACLGEGEFPTLELVEQLARGRSPSGIRNMWIRKEGRIEKNPTRPFIEDLDDLPFPDRDIWFDWIDEGPDTRFAVLLGRGCPFQCSYCSNHALRKLADGRYVRFRSPENIVKEIAELAERFPDKREFYLEVETIAVNKQWTISLCDGLAELNASLHKPLSFGANMRITPGADSEDIFAGFEKANFRHINIGLESGSERVRREILRRNYSNEDVIETVRLARKHGLQVCFFNLIGLPGETERDFHETIKINRACQPDWHFTSIFFPYPGTRLHETCREMGLLKPDMDIGRERSEALLDMPGFGKRQIAKHFAWFNYNVYRGHKPTWRLLTRALARRARSSPAVDYAYGLLVRVPVIGSITRWWADLLK